VLILLTSELLLFCMIFHVLSVCSKTALRAESFKCLDGTSVADIRMPELSECRVTDRHSWSFL